MSYYRLYFLHTFSGHIERFQEMEAERDEEAIERALDQQGSLAMELWCQHRKVARFEAVDLASHLLAQRRVLMDTKAQVEPQANFADVESESRSA